MLKVVDFPENDIRSISVLFVLPVGRLVGGLVKLLDFSSNTCFKRCRLRTVGIIILATHSRCLLPGRRNLKW